MTIACYLEPGKLKASHWMRAFAEGCDGLVIRNGMYAEWADQHVVMGNWPAATALIPQFRERGVPFWYLDSGYLQFDGLRDLRVEPARFWPEFGLPRGKDRAREMGVQLQPWRRDGHHVLICLHGWKFGLPWGINIGAWHETIEARVRAATDRPIVVRPKPLYMTLAKPLEEDLNDAWCLVTHSSTAAVTAAVLGIPVFCEPTCGAYPVGTDDLSLIDTPLRPDREQWLADLAWHQWSESEFRSGEAWAFIQRSKN